MARRNFDFQPASEVTLQNCTCHIVRETLQINYSPAVSVNTPVQNESPVNEFVVRVNMPEMVWFPDIVQTPLDSVSPSNGTVDRINSLQCFPNSPFRDVYILRSQVSSYVSFSHRLRKHLKSGGALPKKGTCYDRLYLHFLFLDPSPQYGQTSTQITVQINHDIFYSLFCRNSNWQQKIVHKL